MTAAYDEAFPCPGTALRDSWRSWAAPEELTEDVMVEITGYPGSKDCEQWSA